MHIVLLKFGENKKSAPDYMDGHNAWILQGISDGIFQCVGSLDVGGGFIMAHGEDKQKLEARINDDPFVINNVVNAEIYEVDIKKNVSQLDYLTQ